MSKLKATKVSYETQDGTSWTAYILGFSGEDAVKHTKGLLGRNFRTIREVSEVSRIDALTDEAREFLKPHLTEKEEAQLICPWCKSKFDNSHGLKIHISKTHISEGKEIEESEGDNIES